MIGIVFALLAALGYGVSAVLIGKRLDASNFFSVSLVVYGVISNVILWPVAFLFTGLGTVNPEGVLFFAIGGILAPGITALFYYRGMEVVGVSVNASIFATYPMFSSLFAVLLLSETIAAENWIGIICMVVGVVYLQRSSGKPETGPERIFQKGLVFPLLAALIRGLSYIAMKHGLNIYNEPLLATAIGYFSTFLLYLLLSISPYTTQSSKFSGKDFRLFWKAGVCSSIASILAYYALSHERVSTVAPVMQTQPLFILLFAHLYLRELEHISFKLIISTLLIVIGAMLVSFH